MSARISTQIIGLAAAALLLASPALAQDVLKLKDGTVLRGKATGYDAAGQVVTFVTQDGSQRKLPLDRLDRLSAYKIAKARAPVGDGPGQLKIANFARDIELYRYALTHYDNARRADPSLGPKIDQELVVLRQKAADYCMRNAKDAIARKDSAGAEKWLTTLVQKLPDEPQAEEASSMISELYAKNHAAKDDELEKANPDLLKTELADGKRYYDGMLARIQDGLANTRKTSQAKSSFDQAWGNGERALRELDKVQKKHSDPETAKVFDGYRDLVRQHMVESQLNIASLLTTSTDYRGALAAVNKALSVDGKNADALQARARIEVASSESGGVGIVGWRR